MKHSDRAKKRMVWRGLSAVLPRAATRLKDTLRRLRSCTWGTYHLKSSQARPSRGAAGVHPDNGPLCRAGIRARMDAVADNGSAEKPIQTFESCLEELEKVVKELETGDL